MAAFRTGLATSALQRELSVVGGPADLLTKANCRKLAEAPGWSAAGMTESKAASSVGIFLRAHYRYRGKVALTSDDVVNGVEPGSLRTRYLHCAKGASRGIRSSRAQWGLARP